MTAEHKSKMFEFAEKAISRLRPSHHYEMFTAEAKSLSDKELVVKRGRYNHAKRNTVVITTLGLGAAASGVLVLGPHLSGEVLLLSSGPTALGICLVGPTRGIVRESEKDILNEEIESRGL